MNFAEKLQILRKQRNISQEQLAEQLYVTRQAVSKWENGESFPEMENIVRLSEILDVSLDYLMKDNIESISPSNGNDSVTDMTDPTDDEYFSAVRRLGRLVNPVATLIFLGLGFIWGLWHPGWVVYVIAWVVKKFLKYSRTAKFNVSIDDISTFAFLATGFIFGRWDIAIFILIATWIIEEEIAPKKKKKKK